MYNISNSKNFKRATFNKYIFIGSVLFYPGLLFCIFYIGVNINSIIMSFQYISNEGLRSFAGLNNFINFINSLKNDPIVSISIINSLKVYILSLVICMPLYLIFSYYIFKKLFAHKTIRILIMLPSVISSFLSCLMFKQFVEGALPNIAGSLGYINFPKLLSDSRYTFGTTLFFSIWMSFSVSLIVYPNAMNGISHEIIESSHIDGANQFQEFFKIVLPLIFPTISTFLILGFAGIFGNAGAIMAFYMFDAYPEVYNYAYYMTVRVVMDKTGNNYPILSAGGMILTLIVAPLTYFLKYLLEKYGPTTEGGK